AQTGRPCGCAGQQHQPAAAGSEQIGFNRHCKGRPHGRGGNDEFDVGCRVLFLGLWAAAVRVRRCGSRICECVSIETTRRCSADQSAVKCAHNLMDLHGKNLIGGKAVASNNTKTFSGVNPVSGEKLSPVFQEATAAEADEAVALAAKAFEEYRRQPAEKTAAFLDRIAEEITKLGDELIQRASIETGLPEARLTGERNRTVNQFKMFAELVRDGSWLEATIDRAQPDRKPLPKVDLRRMLVPLGPVVVFGASNFPLAYSVGGGDTASALAAGCPVVVKAHPAHPGASELVARAIQAAIEATGMPNGVLSMVHGVSIEIGTRLVQHPAAKAVGFTGSLQGGRALFDAAAKRAEPIPVFSEMGSTNPVFILPGALKQNGKAIAEGLAQSVTLGVGQFCTNPGLAFGPAGEDWRAFVARVG